MIKSTLPTDTGPSLSFLVGRDYVRGSLRLILVATIIVLVRDVLLLGYGRIDLGRISQHYFAVVGYGLSLLAFVLMLVAVARIRWLLEGRAFRLVHAATIAALLLAGVLVAGGLEELYGDRLRWHFTRWSGPIYYLSAIVPVLLVLLLAIVAHRINTALGGRLCPRLTFVATIAFASVSVLVASTPVVLYFYVFTIEVLEPLFGTAGRKVASYVRWSVQPLFCVWMIILLLRSSRRLGKLRRCPRCDYDLTGISATRCPECGHDVVRP